MAQKEEYAIILDYLPYGYPLDGKMRPLAQAIGEKGLTLLQLIPRKGVSLELKEKVYIGDGKREKIYYIMGRLPSNKLTENAKFQLDEFIEGIVKEKEKEFVDFFNTAEAINTRVHQIELLPGYGKKHMQEILKARESKKFVSFEDIKKRIPSLPDPKSAVKKRIIHEISENERNRIFVI